MFEGKPPFPGHPAAESLRELGWSELAGRLAAARDLRASLALGEGEGEASFDALSARWIAAHREVGGGVNPEDSGNGKDGGRRGQALPPQSHGGAVRDK